MGIVGCQTDPYLLVSAYTDQAAEWYKKGDYRRAVESATQGLIIAQSRGYDRNYKVSIHYFQRGLAQLKLKEFDLAISDFESVIQVLPTERHKYGDYGAKLYSDAQAMIRLVEQVKVTIRLERERETRQRPEAVRAPSPSPAAAEQSQAPTPAPRFTMDEAKKQCTDLGFKPNTEAYGKCVLQLSK